MVPLQENRGTSNQQIDAGNDPEYRGVSVKAHQQTQMPGTSNLMICIVCDELSIEFWILSFLRKSKLLQLI